MINQNLKDIIYKILGAYALFLTIAGTVLNLVVFGICIRKRLWRTSTFKLIAVLSLNCIIGLYEWNLKHFIDPFFGVDFNFTSLSWCRLSIFLQYFSLQYSAWIHSSIAMDRLNSIIFQNWKKKYFTGLTPLIYIFFLGLVFIAINFHVLFTNGYSIWVNGTEIIVCYAQPDYDYTLFNTFGKIAKKNLKKEDENKFNSNLENINLIIFPGSPFSTQKNNHSTQFQNAQHKMISSQHKN
ncbi:FMRFamide receptor-like [Brachionus plicatilis]|uniref:FMRFamide receptor-like n=1 Tax=Brachionus plicatilis TaxID=10195 RepID=A0A3M7QII1_BRAPC|nr:FMRFamide receptor-like [Brachionus plicatilis]